jgi:O-antigen ligase
MGDWAADIFYSVVLGVGACWATTCLARPFSLRLPTVTAVFVLLAGWPILQLALGWSVYEFQTGRAVIAWSAVLVLFAVGVQIAAAEASRSILIRSVAAAGTVIAVIGGAQFLSGSGHLFWIVKTKYDNQVAGPFVNRDHFCAFLELAIPAALYLAARRRPGALLYAIPAGLMVAAAVASQSRAGSTILLGELLATGILVAQQRSARTAWRPLLAGSAIAIIFAASVGIGALLERFDTDDLFAYRREMLNSSIAMIQDRPLTGFGMGTWPTAYPAYAEMDPGVYVNHAHNDFAEWTAEGGLVVLLALITLFGWAVWAGLRCPWGLGVPAIAAHSFVDFPLQKPALLAIAVILMAAMAAETTKRRRASLHPSGARDRYMPLRSRVMK